MNGCAEGDRRLVAYLEGQLDEPAASAFAGHLSACAECRDALALWRSLDEFPPAPTAPSEAMRRRLAMAIGSAAPAGAGGHGAARTVWTAALAAAAALALVSLGWFASRHAAQPETQALREEVRHLRSVVAVGLLRQDSAAARLQGISYAGRIDGDTRELVDALVAALRFDSNVNVRLAACDALRRYATDTSVRRAFTVALAAEESPLVKLSLIDALVNFRARDSLGALEQVRASRDEDEIVKARAAKAVDEIRANGLTWRQH